VNAGIDGSGRIFHLGGGKEISVEQVAEWINNYDLAIKISDNDEWEQSVARYVEANREELKDHAIFGIVSKGTKFDYDFGCKIIMEKTDKYLEELGVAYECVTEAEFDKCLDRIKSEMEIGKKE
jgi:hypothetical protein